MPTDPPIVQDATADPNIQLMSPLKATRSSGLQPLDMSEIKPGEAVLKVLQKPG
jgi:hypothetical protein